MERAAVELGLDPAYDCLKPETGQDGKTAESCDETQSEDGEGLVGAVAHDVVCAEPLQFGVVGCSVGGVLCILSRCSGGRFRDVALDDVHAC